MKTVILAGGMGTRLAEETVIRPKPMVEIGGRPILWHIMQIYSFFGMEEFVLALGYKGEVIKEYFLNFYALNNDLTLDLRSGKMTVHDGRQPHWRIELVDTGIKTQTGGRLKRLHDRIEGTFCFTYGDGVADVDLHALLAFHKSHGKHATVTAVRPPSRFGGLTLGGDEVVGFTEKPLTGEGWINGGFMVLEPAVFDYIAADETIWEREPMERLAAEGQLMAFKHDGFFQPMDNVREKQYLESLWESGCPPWKMWPS